MPYDFDPRPVRGFAIAALIFIFLAAAILLAGGVDALYENHRFATYTARTEGRVDEKDERAAAGRYGNLHRQHYLSYSYTVSGVSHSSGVKLVAASTWAHFAVHDSIPVIYLPDDPADSRPDLPAEAAIYDWAPDALIPLGLITLAGGGVMLAQIAGFARKRDASRLI